MLHKYLEEVLTVNPEKVFLKTSEGSFTYFQVYKQAVSWQKLLIENGISHGDRVVIYSSKNVSSVALMIACSMCRAIYVPVSSLNPAYRAKYISEETGPKFILCDDETGTGFLKTGLDLTLLYSSGGICLYTHSSKQNKIIVIDNAAFILFTSGSTGTPKGVVISHEAAMVFINWAAEEFEITERDILASIAPFNFDLSVFDIYVSMSRGATLVLYPEELTKNALIMAQNISIDKVSTLYGTPTFYSTLALYGKLHKYEYPYLKNILFAGEVFHLEAFKTLLEKWPDKNYANLYGPTETNVCTFFKVDLKEIDYPVFPIGKACEYASLLLIDEQGKEITTHNTRGDLLVAGQSLFNEYWNDPIKTKDSLFIDKQGQRYYKTGDIVYKNKDDNFVYVDRNDRMIKKNGFRIEPIEVEKVMINFPGITNVAVCFSKDKNQLCCFLESPGRIDVDSLELKKFCQRHLPAYMIPDKFVLLHTMPKTSSGKVDLQILNNQL